MILAAQLRHTVAILTSVALGPPAILRHAASRADARVHHRPIHVNQAKAALSTGSLSAAATLTPRPERTAAIGAGITAG